MRGDDRAEDLGALLGHAIREALTPAGGGRGAHRARSDPTRSASRKEAAPRRFLPGVDCVRLAPGTTPVPDCETRGKKLAGTPYPLAIAQRRSQRYGMICVSGLSSVRASANRHSGSLSVSMINSGRPKQVDRDQGLQKCKI